MHWLIIAFAIASSLWDRNMTQMETSATSIKESSNELESMASEQVKSGQINRVVEMMRANDLLNKKIAEAKLDLERLESSAQK